MTATRATERTTEALEQGRETQRSPTGLVLVAVLSLVVGGVAGWLLRGTDGDATSTSPAGIEELVADYVEAWENKDEAAFRELVTDEFTETMYSNQEIGDYLNVTSWTNTVDQTARAVAVFESAGDTPWQVDQADEVIVAGDGPWYVSVRETWDRSSGLTTDGQATYVVVAGPDGALKIAAYHYVGLELPR